MVLVLVLFLHHTVLFFVTAEMLIGNHALDYELCGELEEFPIGITDIWVALKSLTGREGFD